MPFTPSHAVVALPFLRTPLVPAAIAIGAMTPDLPLFLRGVGLSYGFTHSVANMVWTALIALGLLLMWRLVLRPGLTQLAPRAVFERLPEQWRRTGAAVALQTLGLRGRSVQPLLVAVSLVIGVLSHIGWDMFTHEGRWGVEAIPSLLHTWGPLPGYKWLQHGSSIVGLLILGWFGLRWLRRRPRRAAASTVPAWVRGVWMLMLPIVLLSAWLLGLAAYGPIDAHFTLQHLAYRTLPAASGLWGALTLVLCLGIVLVGERRPRTEASRRRVDRRR